MSSSSRYTAVSGDDADSTPRRSRRDVGIVHLFSRAGVTGCTLFVFGCLLLSLLPGHYIPVSPLRTPTSRGLSPERRHDRTMDDATCRLEFPLLYPQLSDNVAAWRAKGGITHADLDEAARTCVSNWGMARVVIRDGQLFLKQVREGGESRISALLHLLHTAITTDPASTLAADDTGVELVLSEADKDASASDAVWVLSKRLSEPSKGTWLLPDFGFAGWPEAGIASFDEFLHLAALQDTLVPWTRKGDRILWRGLANGYPPRMDLLAQTNPAKVPDAEAWADVKQTSFHDVGADFHPLVPMHEHCRHKYLVQTEGNSYSGRGKFLWACRSVTVAHELEWTQHFHPALDASPTSRAQNMVQLPGRLFAGLRETTLRLQANANVSADQTMGRENWGDGLGVNSPQRIADNAVETLRNRYLTPAATHCYFRAALRAYAGVLRKETWPREKGAEAWGAEGKGITPSGGPGGGVAPGGGKGKDLAKLGVKGDIEYGVWRLSGSPDWPPKAL